MKPGAVGVILLAAVLGCGVGLGGEEVDGGNVGAAMGGPGPGDGASTETDDAPAYSPDLDAAPADDAGGSDGGRLAPSDDSGGGPMDSAAEGAPGPAPPDASSPCGQLAACCKTLGALGSPSAQSCQSEAQSGDAGACQSGLLALEFVGVCL